MDHSISKCCLTCDKPVKGRTDKKFCDDYCRNNYNNQLRSGTNNLVRNINNALRRNRRILENIVQANEEITKASRSQLLLAGFEFSYLTHLYTNRSGTTYYFCYDYGYLPLGEDWFLLVKRNS